MSRGGGIFVNILGGGAGGEGGRFVSSLPAGFSESIKSPIIVFIVLFLSRSFLSELFTEWERTGSGGADTNGPTGGAGGGNIIFFFLPPR